MIRYFHFLAATQLGSLISQERWTDLIEQTTLLLMILGRWLLPNDYLTRESLSQLLLVNLAMAADIIEFFDILKLDFVMDSKPLALTILTLWSWSLMQFPFNLTATFQSEETHRTKGNQVSPENDDPAKQFMSHAERFNKPRASMSSNDFKQMLAAKRASRSLVHDLHANRRYSCQPIPEVDNSSNQNASYPFTHNAAPRGSIVKLNDVSRDGQKELAPNYFPTPSENARRLSVSGRRSSVNPTTDLAPSCLPGSFPSQAVLGMEEGAAARKSSRVTTIDITEVNSGGSRKSRLTGDLVMSFMSLFMEDFPFLTVRLLMIAYYSAFEYMIIFLTVKNALVLTLQVYRLCILYCVCHDHKENDFSPENEVDRQSRLANVQIAVTHEEPGDDPAAGNRGRKKWGWHEATRNIRSPLFFSRAFSRDGWVETGSEERPTPQDLWERSGGDCLSSLWQAGSFRVEIITNVVRLLRYALRRCHKLCNFSANFSLPTGSPLPSPAVFWESKTARKSWGELYSQLSLKRTPL